MTKPKKSLISKTLYDIQVSYKVMNISTIVLLVKTFLLINTIYLS